MKNIEELLTEAGVTIPDDKKESFRKSLNENYKTIAEYDKIKSERDTVKTDLAGVQESLKKFDGVDVDKLKGEIQTLNASIETAKTQHASELKERDFIDTVKEKLSKAGAINLKAAMALLDLDAMRKYEDSSKMDDDIEKCAKENSFAFESQNHEDEEHRFPVGRTGNTKETPHNYTMEQMSNMSFEEYLKVRS